MYRNLLIAAMALISIQLRATTFVPISIKKQIGESKAIVYGEVIELESYREVDGIYTRASVQLDKWIGQNINENQLDVHYPGGQFNDRVQLVHGAPELQLGEKVVLMLTYVDGKYWVNNLGLGKFSIKRVGKDNVMINQIFPGRPEVGQIELASFFELATRVKNLEIKSKFKDKYEIDQDKRVRTFFKNKGRSVASVESEHEKKFGHGVSSYWFVLLLGFLGAVFQFLRNRSS